MRKLCWTASLVAMLLVPSCGGVEITETDKTIDSGESSGSGSIDTNPSEDEKTDDSEYDRTIKIVFSSDGAAVTGDKNGIVAVNGNDVTVNNTSDEIILYVLSGSSSDGFFKLYSSKRQAIELNELIITNPSGAAINNQSHKRTNVILSGTSKLADGSVNSSGNYPDETTDEDMKAAFFSEGQLIFSGSGTLEVNAKGKSGITSDDYLRFLDGPSISVVSTAGHGLRGKEAVMVSGGNIDLSVSATGKKGISTDSLAYFGGGVVTINSSSAAGTVAGELTGAAGIKADQLFKIDGGTLSVTCTGQGSKGINCDGEAYFEGGEVTVKVTGSNYGSSSGQRPWGYSSDSSKAAKGIKADGNIYFKGATVDVSSAAHEGIESKGKIEITAGSVKVNASDDAINSSSDMTISGGTVYAFSSGNDGLDANGNMYVRGGEIYAVGSGSPEVALDANTERGYKLYITGGQLVAFGDIESGSSISQPIITVNSWTRNTTYSLYYGTDLLMEFTSPSSGGNSIVISHPSLVSGTSYTLKTPSGSTSVTASMSAGGGFGGPGGGHGGGPGGRPW